MLFYITLFNQSMLRTQFYIEFKESAFSKHYLKLNKKKENLQMLAVFIKPYLSWVIFLELQTCCG